MDNEFIEKLSDDGVVNKYKAEKILNTAAEKDIGVEEALKESNVETEDILEAKSKHFGFPAKDLKDAKIPPGLLDIIPEDTARLYKFVPINKVGKTLHIGMVDPSNIEARNALQFIASSAGISFEIYTISEEDFNKVIGMYHGLTGEVGEALQEFDVINLEDLESSLEKSVSESKTEKIVEDAPVTKMVAVIVRHAVEARASDIHIEHIGEEVRVRFRVDGILMTSLTLPKNVHDAVVARVKILAKLRLDEKRKPQDGRFFLMVGDNKIDFRVSIMPTFYGEKVVIRILDPRQGIKTLEELGMSKEQTEMIRDAISQPYGLVLITGPTGSGKTTTLYSMLQEIDRDKKNVVSLEDPVEYNIPGINQSQVHAEIDYTFANGLRAIVRQDPDVIMVGEIRDKETAQLAIQAALTGHMVLSTLHTNSSIGVIPRLVDMGVDPYLIAPTLELAIAQRLLRRICDGAAEEIPGMEKVVQEQFADLPEEYKKNLKLDRPVYGAHPTSECPGGVKGRVAIFEMFRVDKEIENIILTDPTEPALRKAARSKGMLTMKEVAILKSMDKKVPFTEATSL